MTESKSLTEQQQAAVTIQGRALLVEAGAGTGKTAVLVERFLHLLAEHPEWPLESIVAVTFTEKAAREMRYRIREGVEARARQDGEGSPWMLRRRSLDRLQVGTIHSLCARLLRENAIAAAVDPRFEVLDEQDAALLQEEAISQTLAGLAQEESPALSLLAALRVSDLKAELVALLEQRGTVSRLFVTLPEPEVLLAWWERETEAMRAHLWQRAVQDTPLLAEALLEIPRLRIPAAADRLAPFVTLAQEGCQKIQAGDLLGAGPCFLPIKLNVGKQDNWGGKEGFAELKEWLKALRTAAQMLEKAGCLDPIGEEDKRAAEALQQWRLLWESVEASYARLKAERQALDFDDLELLTEQLLTEQPEARVRIRASIHHVMVDEFQDTNLLQRQILFALADPGEAGRLFAVGDAKQSIYRFRQAQVSVFNQTGQQIEEATGFAPLPLAQSFRTHAPLLAALNHLFDYLLQPLGATHEAYEARPTPLSPHRAAPPRHPAAPAPVEVLLLPGKDDAGESIRVEEVRLLEARWLAARLLELHQSEFPVWDKTLKEYRPFRFDDAAILFRATTNLPLYEEQFKAAELPYLTVSGRGYYGRPEVQDLIALLTALHTPTDDLSLATVLRSPLFSLSDETLYRLRWRRPDNVRAAEPIGYAQALRSPPPTAQAAPVAVAGAVLQTLWGMTGRVEVWRLLREAVEQTGYEAALALNDGRSGRQRNNVRKFLELAREQGNATLTDFLRWVQALRAREAREGEALRDAPEMGAVQLMSVHAAKGLEFPVVAVADLGRGERGGGTRRLLHDPEFGLLCLLRDEWGDWQKPASYRWGEWLQAQMERAESKRLLYVACTRAADLLLLSGKGGGRASWLAELVEGWEIGMEGAEEELVEREGFTLRLLRPTTPPRLHSASAAAPDESSGVMEVPLLAEPLALTRARALPLERLNEDEVPSLHPVLHSLHEARLAPVPPHVLGALLRRLLGDWEGLALPPAALAERLALEARREGLASTEEIHYVLGRGRALLEALRRSWLYGAVAQATQRHSQLPFTLESPLGTLHGVIDLLYQSQEGEWMVVAWEEGWIAPAERESHLREKQLQLACQAMAAGRVLGVLPRTFLAFLLPELALYEYDRAALEHSWHAAGQ